MPAVSLNVKRQDLFGVQDRESCQARTSDSRRSGAHNGLGVGRRYCVKRAFNAEDPSWRFILSVVYSERPTHHLITVTPDNVRLLTLLCLKKSAIFSPSVRLCDNAFKPDGGVPSCLSVFLLPKEQWSIWITHCAPPTN